MFAAEEIDNPRMRGRKLESGVIYG